jgi:hypothetical protein
MHRTYWLRARAAALLVLVAGLFTACSPFGDDATPQQAAQDRSGRMLTAVEAKTALPSVASLPPGWDRTAKNLMRPAPTKDTLTPARCLPFDHGLEVGFTQAKVRSFATFLHRGHAALGVGIGSHADSPPSLEAMRNALKTCTRFQTVQGKHVTRVTVKPLRLPHLAEDALVSRFKVREQGDLYTYDVVRVRVGHNEILADLITPGTARPNTKPLVTAVRNALLNLS